MKNKKPTPGQLYWTDITVENPTELKDFYSQLFGWQEIYIPMKDDEEDYVDYVMTIDPNSPAGGICSSRGQNKGIPAQWTPYFYVENTEESLNKCLILGGSLLKSSKKKDGTFNYVIVKDIQGAVFGMGNM